MDTKLLGESRMEGFEAICGPFVAATIVVYRAKEASTTKGTFRRNEMLGLQDADQRYVGNVRLFIRLDKQSRGSFFVCVVELLPQGPAGFHKQGARPMLVC